MKSTGDDGETEGQVYKFMFCFSYIQCRQKDLFLRREDLGLPSIHQLHPYLHRASPDLQRLIKLRRRPQYLYLRPLDLEPRRYLIQFIRKRP